ISITPAEARRARGNPVRELELADGRRVSCSAVAIALEPAPLHELASAAGARSHWDPALGGFRVEADAQGRTEVPWLFAAGRVAGRPALESGRAAGLAAAELPAREAAHA